MLIDRLADKTLLRRAAEMGYAPAQAKLACHLFRDSVQEGLEWARKSAAQGDRTGLWLLGERLHKGEGCAQDPVKALALFKQAAELGRAVAQFRYGDLAFGELDWERYYWWGKTAPQGVAFKPLLFAALDLVASFEQGKHSSILFEIAPVCKATLDLEKMRVFGCPTTNEQFAALQRMVLVYEAIQKRAKLAIKCWSIVGKRRNVIKDIRQRIARLLWAEAWRWGGSQQNAKDGKGRSLRVSWKAFVIHWSRKDDP